jgi:hypothetical protein
VKSKEDIYWLLTLHYLLLTGIRQWLSRGSSSVTAAGPRGNCTRFPSFIPHMFWENVGGTNQLCQESLLPIFFQKTVAGSRDPSQAGLRIPSTIQTRVCDSLRSQVYESLHVREQHLHGFHPPTPRIVLMLACVPIWYVQDASHTHANLLTRGQAVGHRAHRVPPSRTCPG